MNRTAVTAHALRWALYLILLAGIAVVAVVCLKLATDGLVPESVAWIAGGLVPVFMWLIDRVHPPIVLPPLTQEQARKEALAWQMMRSTAHHHFNDPHDPFNPLSKGKLGNRC